MKHMRSSTNYMESFGNVDCIYMEDALFRELLPLVRSDRT